MADLFDYQTTYPKTPGHRKTKTSKAAAEAVKPRAPTLRDEVLALLTKLDMHGATADECAKLMHRSVLSVRPRVAELNRLGKIYDSGNTRANDSGVKAIVWRAY